MLIRSKMAVRDAKLLTLETKRLIAEARTLYQSGRGTNSFKVGEFSASKAGLSCLNNRDFAVRLGLA